MAFGNRFQLIGFPATGKSGILVSNDAVSQFLLSGRMSKSRPATKENEPESRILVHTKKSTPSFNFDKSKAVIVCERFRTQTTEQNLI